jgi:hypothetical protein
MDKIQLSHKDLRTDKGVMYYSLGKSESNYVLGIADRLTELNIDNYTVHDQIYFDEGFEKEFFELVEEFDKDLYLKPIWK